jgi:hypothetical protein
LFRCEQRRCEDRTNIEHEIRNFHWYCASCLDEAAGAKSEEGKLARERYMQLVMGIARGKAAEDATRMIRKGRIHQELRR